MNATNKGVARPVVASLEARRTGFYALENGGRQYVAVASGSSGGSIAHGQRDHRGLRTVTRTKATISDVAKHAKVSVGTVSHVLTGIVPVSSKWQERVLKAIGLHYVPNFHARGLRRAQTNVVGICTPACIHRVPRNTDLRRWKRMRLADGYSIMHVFSLQRHRRGAFAGCGDLLKPIALTEMCCCRARRWKRSPRLSERAAMVPIDRPTGDRRFAPGHPRQPQDHARRRLVLFEPGAPLMFICRSRGRLSTRHRIEGLNAARRQARGRLHRNSCCSNHDEAARCSRAPCAPPTRRPP